MKYELTTELENIGMEALETSKDYFQEFEKEHGKKGFAYYENESGQLVVYARGKYSKDILDFLSTLK